jgi:general secretion pathway protein H
VKATHRIDAAASRRPRRDRTDAGFLPAHVHGAATFSCVGACGSSARARGFFPALAHGARAFSRVGACGSSARARGFTLIEVLVVLVIVAVVVGALTLSIGGSGARELENAARRQQGLIQLACERATISGRDIGFAPLQDGMRYGYYEIEGWRPLREDRNDELRPRPWGEGVEVVAERDGESLGLAAEPPADPPFACLASGELTPLRLELARAGVAERWELAGRLDGRIELRRIDDAR